MTWSPGVNWSLMALLLGLAVGADALEADERTSVPADYIATAELHDIPDATLLYAIALQESGRDQDGTGALEPWPWALNVEGQGFYYDSMEQAWDALADFIRQGRSHIGIGLLQVTWPYNRHILWDPYTALDPNTNLSLGARILRDCQIRLGDWWQAVGCYHSPTPGRAAAYRERVRRHWLTLNVDAGRGGDR